MKKRILLLFFFALCLSFKTFSQKGFHFKNPKKKHQNISFELINNLIVIPLTINGIELSFILDTGSNKTILFNLNESDGIGLRNTKKVKLRGLGTGQPVDALISEKNTLSIGNIESNNEKIYIILKDFFDLSSKMGTTIHGIIGYNFFKDFVVEINYRKEKIKLRLSKDYEPKKCKKCEVVPFKFYRFKPYIASKIQLDTVGTKMTDVMLLLDTAGSDALWLFEGSNESIITPKRYFNDILGEGLSGLIYGNRSKIPKFKLGSFKIESPTVSFLDSTSTHIANQFKQRNGSIGGNILKRFKIWVNYRKNTIQFKKNGSFKDNFNYNMSGIDLVYNGKRLVREKNANKFKTPLGQEIPENNSISLVTRYSFNFKPSFKINEIVENSPAYKAGLKIDDVLLSINGKSVHEYKLEEIIHKFQERDNKKIRLRILRDDEKEMKFEFRLQKRI